MNLSQSLIAIAQGALVRRAGWHNGKLWVAQHSCQGFCEPVIAQFAQGETIEWPLTLGRGDWCADDWYELSPEEAERLRTRAEPKPIASPRQQRRASPQRAKAKPSQASLKRKLPEKDPSGASASPIE